MSIGQLVTFSTMERRVLRRNECLLTTAVLLFTQLRFNVRLHDFLCYQTKAAGLLFFALSADVR
jgi:hypothetical protein